MPIYYLLIILLIIVISYKCYLFFGQGYYHGYSKSNAWVYFCAKGFKQDTYVWNQAPFDCGFLTSNPKPSVKLPFHVIANDYLAFYRRWCQGGS